MNQIQRLPEPYEIIVAEPSTVQHAGCANVRSPTSKGASVRDRMVSGT